MKSQKVVKKIKLPDDPDTAYVSCMRAPFFKSTDHTNEEHVFIGMNIGNIYFYSFVDCLVYRHSVKRSQVLKKDTKVVDIKCNPKKMHHLLVCYQDTAVIVYSINKHQVVQHLDKKRAL